MKNKRLYYLRKYHELLTRDICRELNIDLTKDDNNLIELQEQLKRFQPFMEKQFKEDEQLLLNEHIEDSKK